MTTVHPLEPGHPLADPLQPYRDADRTSVTGRPWVLANMVCGLDGSTAVDGRVGELSGPTDRRLFKDLRSVADVVLVGAETARRERYGPPILPEQRRRDRTALGRPPVPRLAILSRSLRLDGAERALRPGEGGERPIVLTCEGSPADRRAELATEVEVLVAGTDRVDPGLALAQLHRHGAEVVLCEGGPTLLGELLGAELVDELCLTLAPVVGGDPLPVANLPATADVSRFRPSHVLEADGDLFLRYVREAA
jgi:riboflavin biosynthesis pyrimidine reductase